MTAADYICIGFVWAFTAFMGVVIGTRLSARRAEPPPEPTVRLGNVRAGRSLRVTGDRTIEVRDGRVYVDGVEWGPKGGGEDRP